MKQTIAFFGTPEYSLIVLNKLYAAGYPIVCVVTKPPRPIGRQQLMTPAPVGLWAEKHHIPIITPLSHPTKPWLYADETQFTKDLLLFKPDILITADYTQKIPQKAVDQIKYGGLNVHPSLLPSYRGPAPVPWALLNGETETGVSLVTLTDQFDAGNIVAQEKEPILDTDTTDTLLTRLFKKGAELLLQVLPSYSKQLTNNNQQLAIKTSYFPRLTRDTGFEPWEKIKAAIETGDDAKRIEQKFRALHPWPGLWTKVKIYSKEKRLKILKIRLKQSTINNPPASALPQSLQADQQSTILYLDQIQLEGKNPVSGIDIPLYVKSLIDTKS